MGRNTFNGGGTILHPGSSFFSHKGGPGRKRKPADGSDTPGPAKPGSICDFGPLRPKRRKVVVVAKPKTRTVNDVQQSEAERLKATAKGRIVRAEKLARRKDAQIVDLKKQLAIVQREYETINVALGLARVIDLDGSNLKEANAKLDLLLRPLFSGTSKAQAKSAKKAARRKKASGRVRQA
ncbi:hypothetical protein HFO77_25455 [Rhizobium leguminosarum]|uniref:hypothetical protein n=1 Tax=Rhizobium leguminosarum TaxID=384 RepID=UPI001C94E2CB|nr:hypothetical protein [Rhizobium leguminosarum]MBY5917743.1 hypothetical protein [Rhizobium leguminosarum]